MKKNLTKILAMAFAGALTLTGVVGFNPASVKADEDTIAYVSFAGTNWARQYWNDGNEYEGVTANTVQVDGNGQYTVSADVDGGDNGIAFLDVEIANGEAAYPDSYMTIDSVKINGEEVAVGATYTSSDDGVATRTNLYNEWVGEITEGRTADGQLGDATAVPVDVSAFADVAITSIEVTFTLGDGVALAGAEESAEAAVDAVDLNGTYNAYIGIQTPAYSFRNAFDDATYGLGSAEFDQITGWDADGNAVTMDGTITDAVIAGNGTYTVSVTGMNFSTDEFSEHDYMNLIFLSTDIPNTGEITISDIVLNVDGQTPSISPILSPDSPNYVNMLIQNIWNDDVKTIGYYNVPPTDISITFTVSGFAYDNEAAAAPADDAAADTQAEVAEDAPASNGISPVVIVVIVVVVIVVIVVIAVAASKKKKN